MGFKKIFSKRSYYYIAILFFVIVGILPILWAFSTSIKPLAEIREWPIYWIPKNLQFSAYIEVFKTRPFFQYMKNSLIVASLSTLVCTILGGLTGYSLSRLSSKFKIVIAIAILGLRLFPPIALLTSWYSLADQLNILDTHLVLVAAYTYMNLPFVIWVMMGFFDEIPREIDDAGFIDGCSKVQLMRWVIVPLAAPGLATAAIFSFLLSWNEYVLAAVLTFSTKAKTLPVGVMEFIGDEFVKWNQLSAGSLLATIPAFIFILVAQKYIVSGLLAGSSKK